jgi:simple sugar transport system ATP-binding protein
MRDRRKIGELDSSGVELDDLIDYIANEGEGSAA